MPTSRDPDLSLFFDILHIIDAERGEKADLIPLTMASRYRLAFRHRVQQLVDLLNGDTFTVWCARPEDVIVGKLMAWEEGRSRKHKTDIYEMLVFHYLALDPELSAAFDEDYITRRAVQLGSDVAEFWQAVTRRARAEAERQGGQR